MADAYATRDDVYRQGVPRGALVSPARVVSSVDVSANRLEIEGHGCSLDTPIQFQIDDGGAVPAPLTTSAVYYARPVTDSESLLEVAATAGGAAIDLTSSGENVRLLVPLGPMLDDLLEVYSRWVDSQLIGHEVPLESPFPKWVTHAVAVRTAAHAARVLGLGSQGDMLFVAEQQVIRDVLSLAKGTPIRDADATTSANMATGTTPTSTYSDARVVL